MNKHIFRLTLVASAAMPTLWAAPSSAASEPFGACDTQLISSATSYPDTSTRARRGGRVSLTLEVAPNGTVANAGVSTSSGSNALDAAALDSARTKWRFAPSACGGSVIKEVMVTFEPSTALTFSATRYADYRKTLVTAAANGCAVTHKNERKSVISCIEPVATARLAHR